MKRIGGITLLILMILTISCGRKAPPIPPRQDIPDISIRLETHVENDVVYLEWALAGKTTDTVAGFIVNRSQTSLTDNECASCPVVFERIATLDITGKNEHLVKNEMKYQEKLAKGYRYVYMITAYGRDGAVIAYSNHVSVIR